MPALCWIASPPSSCKQVALHARHRHPRVRPHALRPPRRRPRLAPGSRTGGDRRPGRARAERCLRRRRRLRRDGRGAPGRRGDDPLAAGLGRAGLPAGRRLGHDQQGLRLRPAGGCLRRPADPRRRRRQRRGGRHGEHVLRAVPAAEGPVRLPDGRRRRDRPHDQRRPHLDVHEPDHGRGEQRRLGGDRLLAGGSGRLGAALPPACGGGDRRRPAGGRGGAGHGARPQGRHRRRGGRRAARRHLRRAAGVAAPGVRRRRRDHGGQRARRQRRRRGAGAGFRGVGEPSATWRRSRGSAPRGTSATTGRTWCERPRRPRGRRWSGSA